MTTINKQIFKGVIDGKEVELAVVRPNAKQINEGQMEYNRAFRAALKSGAILRAKLDIELRDQGLWDDTMQKRLDNIRDRLSEAERIIAGGGVKLNAAKKAALDMRIARNDLAELLSVRTQLDNNTAESQAENKRFDYLVSCCIVYNDSGKTYFNGYQDYQERSFEDIAVQGARLLGSMLYGLDPDFEKNLPENQFLAKFGFINDNMQLIDKQGRLVDTDGRLIDDNGRFIDENGNFVDFNGNAVDEAGKPIINFSPFLDDETGEPILEGTKDDQAETVFIPTIFTHDPTGEASVTVSETVVESNTAPVENAT